MASLDTRENVRNLTVVLKELKAAATLIKVETIQTRDPAWINGWHFKDSFSTLMEFPD
jgi:hypothetical protein